MTTKALRVQVQKVSSGHVYGTSMRVNQSAKHVFIRRECAVRAKSASNSSTCKTTKIRNMNATFQHRSPALSLQIDSIFHCSFTNGSSKSRVRLWKACSKSFKYSTIKKSYKGDVRKSLSSRGRAISTQATAASSMPLSDGGFEQNSTSNSKNWNKIEDSSKGRTETDRRGNVHTNHRKVIELDEKKFFKNNNRVSMSTETMTTQGIVSISIEKASLTIHADGQLVLKRSESCNGQVFEREVTKARVRIPRSGPSTFSSLHWTVSYEEDDGISIVWPHRATLTVFPTKIRCTDVDKSEDWRQGFNNGFTFKFTTHGGEGTSEVTVDMRSSGRWYGGGHLMKQHWPLNNGCWEVGPFMP